MKNVTASNYDLWDLTRTDTLENLYDKYHIIDTKEIASRVRKHLRERFPFCKWSIRISGYSQINISLTSCPFASNSEETTAIAKYASLYTDSYNYDNSDPMTDYFDYNFICTSPRNVVDDDFTQSEMTDELRAISANFHAKQIAYEVAEQERSDRQWQERMERYKAERAQAEDRAQIRKENEKKIEAAAQCKDVDYYLTDCLEPELNKNDTIAEYKEQFSEDMSGCRYVDCRVTREVTLPREEYNFFCNYLLSDYSFLEGMGGANCVAVLCEDETDSDYVLIIDPQGYGYARYVYFAMNNVIKAV